MNGLANAFLHGGVSCKDNTVGGKDGKIQAQPKSSTTSVEFAGGTKRSARLKPLFLVPSELIEAVAETRCEGDRKYEPGNWMKGDREFFVDCLSHAIQHLLDAPWEEEEILETHLGHAATNIAFILWALRRGKIQSEDFRNVARLANLQPPVGTPALGDPSRSVSET